MASEIFQKAKVKLLLQQPFFGVLAIHLIEKVDTSCPTCATDGRYLYINPEWVGQLSEDEKIGLLAHEVMHCAFGHVFPWRRKHRDPSTWNVAGDHVINLMLKAEGLTLPEGGLWDDKYKDKTTEEVYDEVLQEDEQNGNKSLPSWEDIKDAVQKAIEDATEGSGQDGKSFNGNGLTPSQAENAAKEIEREWKDLMVQAATSAKMRGNLPAGVERLVDELVNPVVPWYVLLENFVNEIMQDDYNTLQNDRRYISQGIYLPDLYNEGCNVAVALDTSGSIGQDELNGFASEAIGILKTRNVSKIRLMTFDTKVHMDQTLQPWDSTPKDFPGGGGSDVCPVFNILSQGGMMDKPAALIVLTDMYIRFPKEKPPFPVVWVTETEDVDPPFGTVIKWNPKDCGYEVLSS